MAANKIKVGLLVSRSEIPLWQYQLIEKVKDSVYAEVCVLLFACVNTNNKKPVVPEFEDIILDSHLGLDRILFRANVNHNTLSHISNLLAGTETIFINSTNGTTVDEIAAFAQISNYDLDVILQLDENLYIGEILGIPRYGIWSFRFSNSGKLLGYHEVINHQETLIAHLVCVRPPLPKGQIIYKLSLLPDYLSISKTQEACYLRCVQVVCQILKELNKYGEPYLQLLIDRFQDESQTDNLASPINFPKTAKGAMKHLGYLLFRVMRKIRYRDHWSILYTTNDIYPLAATLNDFKILHQPKDRFWADPFVISKHGKHYIFVEELLYSTNKGHIAVVETTWEGEVLRFSKVLEKEHHLSYPFILYLNNNYYMIPETGANRTIEVYRCTEFPYKWEFVMNLMEDVLTADVTVFFYNDKWWMFCCMDEAGSNKGLLDELHLFYSDDLFTTEWVSHPCNPIVTDVSRARPAGKIYMKENIVYRPSQDCSGMYGKAININQITTLSETEYSESLVTKILPDKSKGIIGTHTFNFSDNIIVVDGFKYISKKMPYFNSL